jgi:hypothetical protein
MLTLTAWVLQTTIPTDTLRDYIAYARSQCKPKLSDDAAQTLIDGYVDMRRQGVSRKVGAEPCPRPCYAAGSTRCQHTICFFLYKLCRGASPENVSEQPPSQTGPCGRLARPTLQQLN